MKSINLGVRLKARNIIIYDPPLYIDKVDIKNTTLFPLLNGKNRVSHANTNVGAWYGQNHQVTTLSNGTGVEINAVFKFFSNKAPSAIQNVGCGEEIDVFLELKDLSPAKTHKFFFPDMHVLSVTKKSVGAVQTETELVLAGSAYSVDKDALRMFKERMTKKREPFVFR